MSVATLAGVYEARQVFEPAAAELLVRRVTPEDVADLKDAAGALAALVNEGTERVVNEGRAGRKMLWVSSAPRR